MVQVTDLNGIPLVEISGEIDIYSADEIFASVRSAIKSASAFVLSLEHCEYCDSSGLSSILNLRKGGKTFAVVAIGQVRRVFDITNLDKFVPVVSSVRDAVERLGPE